VFLLDRFELIRQGRHHLHAKSRHQECLPRNEIGFNTSIVRKAIAQGPAGLRKGQRTALRNAKRYLVEAEDPWKKDTKLLSDWQTSLDARYHAHARYARRWRPRFLAALSVTRSPRLSADHAGIQHQTAYNHRKLDRAFAKQWDEAQEHATDLLEARAFQRALEGDLEPVYYMGVVVDYVRKFDSRLQIEMLRANRADKFKTASVNVNIGARGDVFILTEEQRKELQAINRAWLLNHPIPPSHSVTLAPQQLTNG
jgi:hypothetical protein